MIRVQLVYAEPRRSLEQQLQLPRDSTIGDALRSAQLDSAWAGIDVANAPVGIFGKLLTKEQPLRDGDRIEIYRSLAEEPKLARRRRVSKRVRS